MKRIALVGAMATILAGSLAAPASAQMFAPSAEPVVTDPGQEPRQLLRYEWTEGEVETMRMGMEVATTMSVDGVSVMDMRIPMATEMEWTLSDVLPDGSARFDFVWTAYDVGDLGLSLDTDGLGADDVDTDEVIDVMAEEMGAISQQFVGISGWQVVDTRGAILDFGLDMPEAFPEELRQQLEGALYPVQQLPEGPVGVGARWGVDAVVDSGGLPIGMSVETEVLSLDEDGVMLGTRMLADQDLADELQHTLLGEVPAGVEADVDRFDFGGDGQIRIDFGHVVPTSEASIALDLGMSMTAPDDSADAGAAEADAITMQMEMAMDMSMSIQRVE